MQLNNPTSTDRLCPQLGVNLAAFEVRLVPDGFVKCDECRCVVFGEPSGETPAETPAEPAPAEGE